MKESIPSTPNASESTARISTSPPVDSDSDNDELANTFAVFKDQAEEFGYSHNVAVFSVDRVITAETLPNYAALKETEFVSDKSCIICLKDNMNLEWLSIHYCNEHSLTFTEEEVDILEA